MADWPLSEEEFINNWPAIKRDLQHKYKCESFSLLLNSMLNKRDWRQNDLAFHADLSKATISRIINNKASNGKTPYHITVPTINKIVFALQATPEERRELYEAANNPDHVFIDFIIERHASDYIDYLTLKNAVLKDKACPIHF